MNTNSNQSIIVSALETQTGGGLRTRDWKTRDCQKSRVGKRGTGKRATTPRDWKMREKACIESQMMYFTC